MRLQIHAAHPEPRKIRTAAAALSSGKLIAYPTDTRYAIGASLEHKKAIEAIYQVTGKPKTHPLTLVCPDLSDIARYAVVENVHYRMLKRLFPGPYCVVLPATREVPRMLMSKRKTIGIRVPNHPAALALVRELGAPIVSTSASWQGEEPLADPEDIDARFKNLALVLEGEMGGLLPATMLDLTGDEPEVLREGAGPIDFL